MCIDCKKRQNCTEVCPAIQDDLDRDYVELRGRSYTEGQMDHLCYHASLEGLIAEPAGIDETDMKWIDNNVGLTQKQASVFRLYHIYGEQLVEISHKFGRSRSTMRSYLHRAELKISNYLNRPAKREWSSDEIRELKKEKSILEITFITGLSEESVCKRMSGQIKGGVRSQRELQTNNTSGHTGVCWEQDSEKWRVRFRSKHVGRYDNLDDAINARECAIVA